MATKSAIASQLKTLVNSDIHDWENTDTDLQQRISQALAPNSHPSCIVYPNTQAELAEVIACAYRNKWRVLPFGSGSKLSWGGLAQGIELVVSTQRLTQLIEHAVGDLTVTVEAGAKFGAIQSTLATSKQFLALDPSAPEQATMGGIVATANTGSLRQRYGGVRDQLLGVTFVRADGQIAKAGGRVVKNVAGYDLMKLFTGSYGTLGILTAVTFRVYPLPSDSRTVVLTGKADALAEVNKTLRSSALTPTAADLLSSQLVNYLGVGEGLGLIARFQSMTESVTEQSSRLLEVGQQLGAKGAIYSADDEAYLWRQLQEQMQATAIGDQITCKIGVLPSASVATLTQLDSMVEGMGLIHSGSGLGVLRWDNCREVETLLKMRSLCSSPGGYLSVMQAPIALKQQLDVWGYTGNALDLMRLIKQQFDAENILSSCRFVGGI